MLALLFYCDWWCRFCVEFPGMLTQTMLNIYSLMSVTSSIQYSFFNFTKIIANNFLVIELEFACL